MKAPKATAVRQLKSLMLQNLHSTNWHMVEGLEAYE